MSTLRRHHLWLLAFEVANFDRRIICGDGPSLNVLSDKLRGLFAGSLIWVSIGKRTHWGFFTFNFLTWFWFQDILNRLNFDWLSWHIWSHHFISSPIFKRSYSVWTNFHLTQINFSLMKKPGILSQREKLRGSFALLKLFSSRIIMSHTWRLGSIPVCNINLNPFHGFEIRLASLPLNILYFSFYFVYLSIGILSSQFLVETFLLNSCLWRDYVHLFNDLGLNLLLLELDRA